VSEDEQTLMLSLSKAEWQAIVSALDGDRSHIDLAYDGLCRWAPESWSPALDVKGCDSRGRR
jgi:hypothetical protein